MPRRDHTLQWWSASGRSRQLFFFASSLLLVGLGVDLVTANPLHADTGRKNANGNHRDHLAPSECAAACWPPPDYVAAMMEE